MIIVSIIFSVFLYLAALKAVRASKSPIWSFTLTSLCFAFFPIFGLIFMPPVILQGFLLIPAVVYCSYPIRRPKAIVACSVLATAIAYSAIGVVSLLDTLEWRAEYAMKSVDERVPVPSAVERQKLSDATLARLKDLEGPDPAEAKRCDSIKNIHLATVEFFIRQPGFGVGRMDPFYRVSPFGIPEPAMEPVSQPTDPATFHLSARSDSLTPKPFETASEVFFPMHCLSLFDFINREGFGYFVDRRHVAGFRPHRFSKVPAVPSPYKTESVELAGFVVNPEAVVYVSKNLPNMNELAKAPRRPLDAFEASGHAALLAGDDLFVRDTPTHTRVFGAVRAIEQCTKCHGCERGHLLGAFSYTLKRE